MRKPCIWCDGAGCDDCAAREGGEQGPTPLELELLQVREELLRARADVITAQSAAAEAQRAKQEMKDERDAALAQLALLSREALA